MAPITLAEWADRHGIPYSTATYWARTGAIKATKPGRDWVIDERTKPPKEYQPKGVSKQEAMTV